MTCYHTVEQSKNTDGKLSNKNTCGYFATCEVLSNEQNVWTNYMLNHPIRCMYFLFLFSESTMSSHKLVLFLAISCVLLSMYSHNVQGQLPGIRWGRGFQHDDVIQRGDKGKLWELMEKRKTSNHHQLAGTIT